MSILAEEADNIGIGRSLKSRAWQLEMEIQSQGC